MGACISTKKRERLKLKIASPIQSPPRLLNEKNKAQETQQSPQTSKHASSMPSKFKYQSPVNSKKNLNNTKTSSLRTLKSADVIKKNSNKNTSKFSKLGLNTTQNDSIKSSPKKFSFSSSFSSQNSREVNLQQVQFFNTNITKKYTLIYQKNNTSKEVQFIENIRSGQKFRLAILCNSELLNVKFVSWVKLQQLDHPNILKPLEIYQDENNYQIVYQYFKGQKLNNLNDLEIIDEQILANIADQMFSVLVFCKKHSLIHSNLTLNNWEFQIIQNQITIKLVNLIPFVLENEKNPKVEGKSFENNYIDVMKNIYKLARKKHLINKKNKIAEHKQQQDSETQQKIQGKKRKQKIDKHLKEYSNEFRQFLKDVLEEKGVNITVLEIHQNNQWILNYKYQIISIQQQLLQNLLAKKKLTGLQIILLDIMISEFDKELSKQGYKLFDEFDTNSDDQLTKQQIIQMFEKYYNCQNLENLINNLFQKHNFGDALKFNNFIILSCDTNSLLTEQNITFIFNIISKNKMEITFKDCLKYNENLREQLNLEENQILSDGLTFQEFNNLIMNINLEEEEVIK